MCLIFIESVLILEGALKGISSDYFDGQVLFRDSAVKVTEQLPMTIDLTAWFNESAEKVGASPIDLDPIRNSLQSQVNGQISSWVNLARLEMLDVFGTEAEFRATFESLLGPSVRQIDQDIAPPQ